MLQPFHVGVFGPFQHAWLDQCDSIMELTGSEMPKEDFIKKVRERSFHPSTFMSAFKKSGTWPVDRSVFTEDDLATSILYSTEAHDFPPLSEFESLSPLNLDPDDRNSDNQSESDSDSEFDSDSDIYFDSEPRSHHPQPQISHSHPMFDHSCRSSMSTPTPTPSTLPATSSTVAATKSHYIDSLPTQISSLSPIPTTQFYHDPALFERISHLEASLEQLTGQVKMVELELQNEKQKYNQHDSRASKWQKLNVEAWVLTSAQLGAEKDAERAAKEQKKRDAAM